MDTTVDAREQEKWGKYQELAADMAKREPGYQVAVVPLVVGDLGVIHSLRAGIGLLDDMEVDRLLAEGMPLWNCTNSQAPLCGG